MIFGSNVKQSQTVLNLLKKQNNGWNLRSNGKIFSNEQAVGYRFLALRHLLTSTIKILIHFKYWYEANVSYSSVSNFTPHLRNDLQLFQDKIIEQVKKIHVAFINCTHYSWIRRSCPNNRISGHRNVLVVCTGRFCTWILHQSKARDLKWKSLY